jgi:hypothetical protein
MAEVPSFIPIDSVINAILSSRIFRDACGTFDVYREKYLQEYFIFIITHCVNIYNQNQNITVLELSERLVDIFVESSHHDSIEYYGLEDDAIDLNNSIMDEVIEIIS